VRVIQELSHPAISNAHMSNVQINAKLIMEVGLVSTWNASPAAIPTVCKRNAPPNQSQDSSVQHRHATLNALMMSAKVNVKWTMEAGRDWTSIVLLNATPNACRKSAGVNDILIFVIKTDHAMLITGTIRKTVTTMFQCHSLVKLRNALLNFR